MARTAIDGIGIEYELLGPEDGRPVVITPGGRFSLEAPGIREMAQGFADLGWRALIYDRPNCGRSDLCLAGESESEMQADVLAGLIRALGLGPCVVTGGSGGSRVSLLVAARHPDVCAALAIWWISGEPVGLMKLASHYCGDAATAASRQGMAAVVAEGSWADNCAANPAARETLLGMETARFIAIMQRWAAAYAPCDISPVPGMTPRDFAQITAPALVFRSDTSDLAHPESTSLWVHRLLPHARLAMPPWRADEWNWRSLQPAIAEGRQIFCSWPLLVPLIRDFVEDA